MTLPGRFVLYTVTSMFIINKVEGLNFSPMSRHNGALVHMFMTELIKEYLIWHAPPIDIRSFFSNDKKSLWKRFVYF